MLKITLKAALPCVLSALMLAGSAQADTPALKEPLTLVVGYAPGGASDRAARIVGEALQKKLGVSVVVENKTGAGGRIAAQYVKSAPADKNVLILGNPAVMVVAPLVFEKLEYDAVKDFQPVSMVTQYGFGVAVSADNDIKDMQGLVKWAKENPGKFNIGVPATGSLPHFFGLMLADRMGVKGEIVGYRGSAPAITDLIGGVIPVAIDTLDVLTRQHEGKRIRILATSGKEREKALPDVPTFTDEGIDLVASGWNAFFASASMPADKVKMLGQAIKAVTAEPSVRQTLVQNDLIPVSADAVESGKLIDAFRSQWEPVVKASGFVVTK
ncbi:ABC transporter substrate-binding protein [Allopusillimonas soli]|uniref:ABC transporter substrate-binding protein n=1 Tax=Allopusillimonas soli TaxID=659016 RepID=A0A853F700_9BURK|nr:tripartite tricarboxylate transporter substrate-binding protein [Allopusillimonas soli]NYT35598.1 ABC transporter substrate-binding protein [Allopusillimonas soli]TEA76000.1 ABC transporter substrate-binding protein [Allopusillimonas soli]